jgi:hypothetical protein
LVTYYDADGHNALPLLNEQAGTDEIVGHCFDRLLLGNGMYNSSVVVKRAALDVVGIADLSIPGNTVQDYDLWLRVAKQFPFGLVPHSTTMLRIHGEQGIWNRSAMLEAELQVLFKNCPAEDWQDSAARRARLAGLYDAIGVAHLDAGAAQRARPYFRRACATQPSKRAITRFLGSLLPVPLIDLAKRAFGRSKAA